jgi:hypothetical protein
MKNNKILKINKIEKIHDKANLELNNINKL